MRISITGGAGFIGSNLAREALAAGHDVTILDDLSTGYRDNIDSLDTRSVRFIEGSLLDEDSLAAAIEGADSIVHLAALGSVPRSIEDPFATHQANATGTLLLLRAATERGVGHVVTASSSSVYGLNPALPKNEREWVRAMSPYAVTKLAQEQYTLAWQQSYGLRSIAFRFFNVYGPRQRPGHAYAAVIPVFLEAILSGRPLPINGDGRHSRDFTYVETVCRALLAAATGAISHPEPVNLAFGTNTSLLDLVGLIERVTGRTARVEHRDPRPGDVVASMADNAVLRALMPELIPVPIGAGLAATAEWMESIL